MSTAQPARPAEPNEQPAEKPDEMDPRERPLWAEQFSPRQVEDRFIARRELGRFLILTSAAMFAGNVWIWIRSRLHRLRPIVPRAIARLGEIPVGTVKSFSFPTPNDPCLLIRRGPDEYVAFEQKCPHLSCAVIYSAERDRLECPCHQGYFSATTGAVLQGPPPRPLARIRLERHGAELVAVGLETAESS